MWAGRKNNLVYRKVERIISEDVLGTWVAVTDANTPFTRKILHLKTAPNFGQYSPKSLEAINGKYKLAWKNVIAIFQSNIQGLNATCHTSVNFCVMTKFWKT